MNPFARRTYGTLERVTERVYLFRNIVNIFFDGLLSRCILLFCKPLEIRKINLVGVHRKPDATYFNQQHFVVNDLYHFSFFIGMQNDYIVARLVFHRLFFSHKAN